MTTPQPTRDDINAAINTAARRMTTTPPSADLRARVMSHIDVLDNRVMRPRWGLRLVLAGGAIASVAILVAMQLVSPKVPTGLVSPKPEAGGLVSPMAKADPTVAPALSSPVLSTASVKRTTTRRAAIAVNAAENAVHAEWLARGLPALEQPAAPRIDALEHPVLSIEAIDITPLSVAPLTVPVQGSNNGSSNK